jgi:hypothetical protein
LIGGQRLVLRCPELGLGLWLLCDLGGALYFRSPWSGPASRKRRESTRPYELTLGRESACFILGLNLREAAKPSLTVDEVFSDFPQTLKRGSLFFVFPARVNSCPSRSLGLSA